MLNLGCGQYLRNPFFPGFWGQKWGCGFCILADYTRLYTVLKQWMACSNIMEITLDCKIFIYVHKNLFTPQAPDISEKLAECLLYNFHRDLILLKLKIKKLLEKISSKNLTAGV